MSKPALDYTVRDKSLLLPLYKKLFIEPIIPQLPQRLAPNVITHAGHLVSLLGVMVLAMFGTKAGGAPFFFAAAAIHVYNWCDNADGAHARHSKQCSVTGEFLDHGLDLLNATYVAAVGAMAIGASPLSTLTMVLAVVAAAATIYWEQAETGTFQLGWLNQIESVFAASALLVVAGVFGTDVFLTEVGPFSIRTLLCTFLCANAIVSIVQSAVRVARRKGALLPFAQIAAFGAAVFLCASTRALSPEAAGVIGITGYVFLGVRNLTLRLRRSRPVFELGVVIVTFLLGAYAIFDSSRGLARAEALLVEAVGVALAFALFAFYATVNLCVSRRLLARLDAK